MGIQILIPHNKNKEFMLSTTIPAIVSVGLNLLLLPKLGYIGAAIVSVLTEVLVWLIQLFYTRSYLREVPIFRFIDQNYNLIWSYVWYLVIYKTIPKCITDD